MCHAETSTIRVFCAVELTEEARSRVAAHLTRLRQFAPAAKISWEREEKLHLTLKFFGEVETTRIDALTRATMRAASGVGAFELSLEGTGAFPPRGNPRLLWIGIDDPSAQLTLLQQRLEDACERAGFPRETRPFRPHLTIARVRTPDAQARRLTQAHLETKFEAPPLNVREIVLMRSELQPEGARHTALSRHSLKAEVGGQ